MSHFECFPVAKGKKSDHENDADPQNRETSSARSIEHTKWDSIGSTRVFRETTGDNRVLSSSPSSLSSSSQPLFERADRSTTLLPAQDRSGSPSPHTFRLGAVLPTPTPTILETPISSSRSLPSPPSQAQEKPPPSTAQGSRAGVPLPSPPTIFPESSVDRPGTPTPQALALEKNPEKPGIQSSRLGVPLPLLPVTNENGKQIIMSQEPPSSAAATAAAAPPPPRNNLPPARPERQTLYEKVIHHSPSDRHPTLVDRPSVPLPSPPSAEKLVTPTVSERVSSACEKSQLTLSSEKLDAGISPRSERSAVTTTVLPPVPEKLDRPLSMFPVGKDKESQSPSKPPLGLSPKSSSSNALFKGMSVYNASKVAMKPTSPKNPPSSAAINCSEEIGRTPALPNELKNEISQSISKLSKNPRAEFSQSSSSSTSSLCSSVEILASPSSPALSRNQSATVFGTKAIKPLPKPPPKTQEGTKFSKAGFVYKRKIKKGVATKWKQRYFQLHASKLLYFATALDTKPLGEIPIVSSKVKFMAVSPIDKPFCFELLTVGCIYHIATDTEQDMIEWSDLIESVKYQIFQSGEDNIVTEISSPTDADIARKEKSKLTRPAKKHIINTFNTLRAPKRNSFLSNLFRIYVII